jgi:hypothetical protein
MTNEIPEKEQIATDVSAEPVPEHGSGQIGSVRHSPAVGHIASALAAAQLEFLPIYKENENPAFRSKYADLATVIAATQKAMAKQGLVVIQSPTTKGKDLILTTVLLHSSGEWMSSDLSLPATMRDGFTAQTIGSACTYARRYALQAMIGVAADVDEDGNLASGVGTREAAQAVAKAKIAEHEQKANGSLIPALFYTWYDESQTARIEGDHALMEKNRDLLTRFWAPAVRAVVVDAEQLENLKFALEQRNVPFKLLKTVGSLEKQLENSIEDVKRKKTPSSSKSKEASPDTTSHAAASEN